MRDSMVIYRSIYEAMKKAKTAELKAKIIMAIMAYGFDGEEYTDDDPTVSIVFDLIKPQIDANNRRYENGKRGGRPKKAGQKPNEAQENPENQVGYLGIDEKPNQNQTITKPKPNQNQTITKPKPNQNQTITKPKPNNNQTITKVEPHVHVHDNVHVNVHVNDDVDDITPKGESDTDAKGQISKSETIPVDTSTQEEKKKVPPKKKRSKELPKDGGLEYVPIGQVAEWMKSNTVWLEAFCMNKHLDPEAVKRKIDDFAAHCANNGETEKEKHDCIRHFNNWMRRMQDEPPRPRTPVGRVKHPAANFDNNQTFEEW